MLIYGYGSLIKSARLGSACVAARLLNLQYLVSVLAEPSCQKEWIEIVFVGLDERDEMFICGRWQIHCMEEHGQIQIIWNGGLAAHSFIYELPVCSVLGVCFIYAIKHRRQSTDRPTVRRATHTSIWMMTWNNFCAKFVSGQMSGPTLSLPLTSEMNASRSAVTGLRCENMVMMNFGGNARFVVLFVWRNRGDVLREIYCVHQTDILLKNDTQMVALHECGGCEGFNGIKIKWKKKEEVGGSIGISSNVDFVYGRAGRLTLVELISGSILFGRFEWELGSSISMNANPNGQRLQLEPQNKLKFCWILQICELSTSWSSAMAMERNNKFSWD